MSLLRRDASEAIQRRFPLSPNQFGPLSELDHAFQTFSGALTSAMAMFHGTGRSVRVESNFTRGSTRRDNDDSSFVPGLSRSHLVGLKLAELKAASSPSRPLCFHCGAPGHIANQCRNATLCFVCNRFGHRSLECGSLTAQPAPRAPIPYYQVSVRGSIKELELELSELKQELARVRQRRSEMELALTGITSQIHLSETQLTEIEAAIAARKGKLSFKPDNQPQDESDNGFRIGELTKGKETDCTAAFVTDPSCSQNSETDENRSQEIENETRCEGVDVESIQDEKVVKDLVGVDVASGLCEDDVETSNARYSNSNFNKQESNRGDTIPVNPVNARYSTSNPVPVNPVTETFQEVVVSQLTRTKKMKGMNKVNKVTLSREDNNVQFKRVAMKVTERAEKKGHTSKKIAGMWLPANCARWHLETNYLR